MRGQGGVGYHWSSAEGEGGRRVVCNWACKATIYACHVCGEIGRMVGRDGSGHLRPITDVVPWGKWVIKKPLAQR